MYLAEAALKAPKFPQGKYEQLGLFPEETDFFADFTELIPGANKLISRIEAVLPQLPEHVANAAKEVVDAITNPKQLSFLGEKLDILTEYVVNQGVSPEAIATAAAEAAQNPYILGQTLDLIGNPINNLRPEILTNLPDFLMEVWKAALRNPEITVAVGVIFILLIFGKTIYTKVIEYLILPSPPEDLSSIPEEIKEALRDYIFRYKLSKGKIKNMRQRYDSNEKKPILSIGKWQFRYEGFTEYGDIQTHFFTPLDKRTNEPGTTLGILVTYDKKGRMIRYQFQSKKEKK